MNTKTGTLISLFLAISTVLFGQTKTAELYGDCSNAAEIIPAGTYTFKSSPVGYGENLEIHNNPNNSKYFFAQENNTAWFTFVAKKPSLLTFQIKPLDVHTDFDFLVFEYSDEDFCADLAKKKILPIRTNISRFDTSKAGVTGLSAGSNEPFVNAGIGNNFSQALQTEAGKRYYIVINNVYGSNTPFKIQFAHYTTTIISGKLSKEETGAIVGSAKITWEESSGEILSETTTDQQTGEYRFEVPIVKSSTPKQYILTATDKNYNFSEKIILASQKDSVKQVEIVLPKLVKGETMSLHNVHFYGDQAITLPTAQQSLKRLYKFMKHNSNLSIRIEGHTNGSSHGTLFSQKLSTDRAKTVKKYLVEKGIPQNRVSIIGYGGSRLLYPINSSAEKQSLNRRVEFVIVDFSANTKKK